MVLQFHLLSFTRLFASCLSWWDIVRFAFLRYWVESHKWGAGGGNDTCFLTDIVYHFCFFRQNMTSLVCLREFFLARKSTPPPSSISLSALEQKWCKTVDTRLYARVIIWLCEYRPNIFVYVEQSDSSCHVRLYVMALEACLQLTVFIDSEPVR